MKKFVSKMLAGALGLSMLCGVAAAEGETYVSWYTFGDVYLSSVRTALDAAMEAKGLTVVDKDSNANQQTQTDDINTALVTGANAVVVNLVESGAIGTRRNPDERHQGKGRPGRVLQPCGFHRQQRGCRAVQGL